MVRAHLKLRHGILQPSYCLVQVSKAEYSLRPENLASVLIPLFLTPYSQSAAYLSSLCLQTVSRLQVLFHSQCHQFFSKQPPLPLVTVTVTVHSLSHVQLFVTPRTAAYRASLSFTISWSLLKLMSIESVMPSNHLILCCPFSFCLQSCPASGSFPMSRLFTSGGQSIGASVFQWIFRVGFL